MKKISFIEFQMKKKLESTVNTVKYLCVQNRQVFSLNRSKISYIWTLHKVRFRQDSGLFRVHF